MYKMSGVRRYLSPPSAAGLFLWREAHSCGVVRNVSCDISALGAALRCMGRYWHETAVFPNECLFLLQRSCSGHHCHGLTPNRSFVGPIASGAWAQGLRMAGVTIRI